MIKMCFCKALYDCVSIHPYVDFRLSEFFFFFLGGGGRVLILTHLV